MDPDLRTVADAVASDGLAMAAFARLVSKTGNVPMLCQMLDYSAEEVGRLHAKLSSMEGSLLRRAFDLPTPPAPPPPPSLADEDEEREPERETEEAPGADEDEDEDEADDGLARELERSLEEAADDAGSQTPRSSPEGKRRREEETPATDGAQPSTEDMIKYLKRPTKVLKTFDRFYQRYGDGEITRTALGEFIGDQPDLLHKSSANKLFHAPKGFGVGLFVRKGSFVKLAKQWIDAWEETRRDVN